MIRAALALVLVLGIAPAAFAQAGQGVPSVESEVRQMDPAGCAANAIDVEAGVFGGGFGATREAAREDALRSCRDEGGTRCTIDSVSCNPDARGAGTNAPGGG